MGAQDSEVREAHLGARRRHPAGPAHVRDGRPDGDDPRQGRVPEPRRLGEGPHRAEDDRGRRGERRAAARRHDRRADQREHRRRPGARRPAQGLPLRVRLPGQGQPGQARRAARLRRARSSSPRPPSPPDHPDSYYSVSDRLVARDPGRLEAEPVRQPERPGQPLRDDRPGDLGRHRRSRHARRRRRRHRRHDHRHRALPARTSSDGPTAARARHRRRPRGLGVLRRRRAAVPGRGRRRGLLADRLRPDGAGRDHRRLRRRLLRDDAAARPRGGPAGRRLVRHGGRGGPAARPPAPGGGPGGRGRAP